MRQANEAPNNTQLLHHPAREDLRGADPRSPLPLPCTLRSTCVKCRVTLQKSQTADIQPPALDEVRKRHHGCFYLILLSFFPISHFSFFPVFPCFFFFPFFPRFFPFASEYAIISTFSSPLLPLRFLLRTPCPALLRRGAGRNAPEPASLRGGSLCDSRGRSRSWKRARQAPLE